MTKTETESVPAAPVAAERTNGRKRTRGASRNVSRALTVDGAQVAIEAFGPAPAAPVERQRGVRVRLDRIDVPNDVLKEPMDEAIVEDLVRKLPVEGQTHDIILVPHGPRFELFDGRHRMEAARRLGWPELTATLDPSLAGVRLVAARASVNRTRRVVSPYGEALQYAQLRDQGVTLTAIAAWANRSEDHVRQRLRILDLPEDLRARVGEPGFSLEHLDVVLPFVEHPELLKQVVPLIGQKAHDGRLLGARDLANEIRRTLQWTHKPVLQRANDYRFEAVARTKEFKEKVKTLPTIKLPGDRETLVVDAGGELERIRQAHEVERRKRLQKAAKTTGKKGDRAKEQVAEKARLERNRRERELQAATDVRVTEVVQKAVQKVAGLGGREIRVVAHGFLTAANWVLDGGMGFHGDGGERPEVRIAAATGIPVKELEAAMRGGKKLEALVEALARKKDQAPFARLLVAAAVEVMRDGDQELDAILKPLAGVTRKDLEKKARKDLEETRKAAKRATPAAAKKARGKKTTAAAPAHDDAEDVDEGDVGYDVVVEE